MMNRFRTKKKAKEAPTDPDASSLPSLPFMKSKKKPETKTEFDLSNALPSEDDFRTSLLMPKLSARFSMLREQDDPNSKLGKASDDSVLFPRRESRLNLFGHNQLSEIAEISSLTGSARPSLAIGRGSYASGEGYGTDDDPCPGTSIMNRPRPGEGNNLFGGRQKIYKIPVNSTSRNGSVTDSVGSGGGMGKLLYEDDVNLSAWQRWRQQEREQEEEESSLQPTEEMSRGDTPATEASPPANGTENRTASTTSAASSTRLSAHESALTPATIAADRPAKQDAGTFGVDRNPTKTRRLYGQGLELHSQQSSVISRIENLNRQRSVTGDASQMNRSLSRSAMNLNERFQSRASPLYASSGFRPASPPPSTTSSISGISEIVKKGSVNGHSYTAPLSPPVSESDEMSPFAAAIHPEDRGKATATGLFNKPATKYDDDQFSRRQLQMHESRTASSMRQASPARTSSGIESVGRPRGLSTISHQSKAESATSRYSESHDEGRRSGNCSRTSSIRKPSPPRPTNGTFLANLSGSESDDDVEIERPLNSKLSFSSQNCEDVHPAFRTGVEIGDPNSSRLQSDSRDLNTIEENVTAENTGSLSVDPQGPDSPTLGPSGLGLSGLIRTHLRQPSDKSSIIPPSSPGLPPASIDGNQELVAPPISRSASHTTSVHSNPFEYDDWAKSSTSTLDRTTQTPAPAPTSVPAPPAPTSAPNQSNFATTMSSIAKQMLGQAEALSAQARQVADQKPMETENERSSDAVPSTPWQEEMKSGHHRTGSSETQMDREEFANELAERRRKVQEKLRSIAESESRSSSPGPSHQFPDFSPVRSGNAFTMLKSRKSQHSGKSDAAQAKPSKLLGLDTTASSSSPNLTSKDVWREEEERMRRDRNMQPPRSASPYIGSPQIRTRHPHAHPKLGPRSSQEEMRGSSYDDPYRKSERRDRSGSEGSGRSKSRPRHREDLESVIERTESPLGRQSTDDYRGPSVPSSVPSSTRPSFEVNDRSGGRFRSNSRPIIPSNLDASMNAPVQPSHPALIGNSPRPSPVTPFSANTTPPLYETSASTGTNSQRSQGLAGHKRVVDKSTISEPTLVSTTNHVPTVELPAGASLSNGSNPPPIPPLNPRRRRQTTTQALLGAFRMSDKTEAVPSADTRHPEEHSIFSDEDKRSRPRQRLRKISSEEGNLNTVRPPATRAESPSVPQFFRQIPMDGGMF
ncbi:hypothetical protein VTO42DRAFT_7270 [Malbranchea cinnamomea]